MKYTVHKETIVYDGYFQIVEGVVSFDSFSGKTIQAKRYAFERGDAAAILVYEKNTDSILLAKQFRYPTCRHNSGWIAEIPAGSISENESPQTCIVRETKEELGYQIQNPELLHVFYTSPGGSSERIFLFYDQVTSSDKIEKSGGRPDENEDIKLIKFPVSELPSRITEFSDAKTILALQWFLLNRKKIGSQILFKQREVNHAFGFKKVLFRTFVQRIYFCIPECPQFGC